MQQLPGKPRNLLTRACFSIKVTCQVARLTRKQPIAGLTTAKTVESCSIALTEDLLDSNYDHLLAKLKHREDAWSIND